MRYDVVDEVRRGPRPAPRAAQRTEALPLAAERQQLVMTPPAAAQQQEAMREDVAFQEGFELVLDELK